MAATEIMTHDSFAGRGSVKGHHNPTKQQVANALKKSKDGRLRTVHYKDSEGVDNTFVWDANSATHDQVARGEGIHKQYPKIGNTNTSGDDKMILTTSHNARETKVKGKGKHKTIAHPSGHEFMRDWKHRRTYSSGGEWNKESGHTHGSDYFTDWI